MRARPFPVLLGLLLVALVTVLAVGQLGIVGASSPDPSASVRTATPAAPGSDSPATVTSPPAVTRTANPGPATRSVPPALPVRLRR